MSNASSPHPPAVRRRLAAIVAMDVAEYSRRMASDEADTLGQLKDIRQSVIEISLTRHSGRLVKSTGDGFLAEFNSAVEAMQFAMLVQTTMAEGRSDLRLRIGINVGDVVVEDGDLFGDGVNLAARLESIAPVGGVAFSSLVRDALFGRIDGDFEDIGFQPLKNIDRPVNVWTWRPKSASNPDGLSTTPDISQPTRTTTQSATPAPDKPSIVVLPFDCMSRNPEDEHLTDGVVESITAVLSRIRSFFVIARNTAFAFKGQHRKAKEIGQELGVNYMLEGSLQRSGARLRITIQLIDTHRDAHLWAERYDGSIDEIFDLQDRITERVAAALQPSIRLAEVERARSKRPQDMGAYDYVMRAMPFVWHLDKRLVEQALELLDQALKLDPDYAMAKALAGWCWAQRSVYNWVDDPVEAQSKALALAQSAAEHASDDPMVLAVLGAIHGLSHQYGVALVILQKSVALDPNGAWAHSRLGYVNVALGRAEQAREHFETALRLSPLDPMNFNNHVGLATAQQLAEDDEDAAEGYLKALAERPTAHWIHRHLAPSLQACGRHQEAKASVESLLNAYPDFTVQKFKSVIPYSPGHFDRVARHLRDLGVPDG